MSSRRIYFTVDPGQEIEMLGMLENLRRLPAVYPGWTPCIVVPETADPLHVNLLRKPGVIVEPEQTAEVFVHRSLVSLLHAVKAPSGTRFLVRSPYCRVGRREAAAVAAWEASGAQGHVIRDHPVEHNVKIVPHLWGSFQMRVQQHGKKIMTWLNDLYQGRTREMLDLTQVEAQCLAAVVWPRLVNWGILRHDPYPRDFDHPAAPWPAYEPDDQESCGIVYLDAPEKGTIDAIEERQVREGAPAKHPGNDPRGETQGCCGGCGI